MFHWSYINTLNAEFLGIVPAPLATSLFLRRYPFENYFLPSRINQLTPLSNTDGEPLPRNPDGTYKTTDKVNFNDAWAEIEKLLDTGKVRAIGVSNFSIKTYVLFPFTLDSLRRLSLLPVSLEKLFTTAKVTPAVNQVEYVFSFPIKPQYKLHVNFQVASVSRTERAPGLLLQERHRANSIHSER